MICDTLTRSVTGDLVPSVFLDLKQDLEMPEQGKGAPRLEQRIEFEQFGFVPSASIEKFEAKETWNIIGTVDHWGHVHTRQIRYRAEMTVRLFDGRYKVASMDIRMQDPIKHNIALNRLSE